MICASAFSNFRILLSVCYAYLRVYAPIEFEPVKNVGIRNIHRYFRLRDVRKGGERLEDEDKTQRRVHGKDYIRCGGEEVAGSTSPLTKGKGGRERV